MTLALQGYYAILDVKGSSVDVPSALRQAAELLVAEPCCLQLRGKDLGSAALCQLGRALRPLCMRIPLCINDRLDVALAVGADAVHLGQGDLPLAEALRARAVAQANLAIGVSTHDVAEARIAAASGADYIGFGPVFVTGTKADTRPAVGVSALREVARAVKIPVVAIGGITSENVAEVVGAGASAAAVIADIEKSRDRALAGRRIAAAFRV